MTGLVYVLFMYIGLVDDRVGLCISTIFTPARSQTFKV